MKNFFILPILLFCFCFTEAQNISILFQPANEYFFTRDQVWNFTVSNSQQTPINATMKIRVMKDGSFTIMEAQTGIFEIKRGVNTISSLVKSGTLFTYSGNEVAAVFHQTGILQPGNYAICVSVTSGGNQIAYSCNEVQIKNFTPPFLSYPLNKETIYTNYPALTWIPVFPVSIINLSYKFELWEANRFNNPNNFKAKGNLIEATVNKKGSLQYQIIEPSLETGETYAWKVSAFSGDYYLGSSEIWQFTVGLPTSTFRGGEGEDAESYRMLGVSHMGSQYVSYGTLKIAYQNIANDSILSYKIAPVDTPNDYVSGLPEVLLYGGINSIDIDLEETELFTDGIEYVLEVRDGNERFYYLNFVYTEL